MSPRPFRNHFESDALVTQRAAPPRCLYVTLSSRRVPLLSISQLFMCEPLDPADTPRECLCLLTVDPFRRGGESMVGK